MPLAAVESFIRGLLDGLPMPGGAPNLACPGIPPDPNAQPDYPVAYIWLPDGRESRDGPAGTMPRNTGPGTFSGDKTIEHQIDVYVTWFDPGPSARFLGIIDAIEKALRTSVPNPVPVTDPYTGEQSQVADTGEKLSYSTRVRPAPDQRYNRYDALIQVPVTEVISA